MTSVLGHFGHLRSCDMISWHVTASCELQPCRNWNVQYTWVFGLLQPLPGDFRSNDVTSGSLPVPWRHVTSFPVTWLNSPASYSLVGSEMYSVCLFSAFHSRFQVTSNQMTSLQDHFRSLEDTWRQFLSRDCLLLRATTLWEVKCTGYAVFGLPQPLKGDFRSNDVTSRLLLVTWCHVTSFLVTWLSPASYSLVGIEIYSIHQVSAFHSHFQVTSGQMTSLPGHFRSPEVTWRHFMPRDCLLQRATALY